MAFLNLFETIPWHVEAPDAEPALDLIEDRQGPVCEVAEEVAPVRPRAEGLEARVCRLPGHGAVPG